MLDSVSFIIIGIVILSSLVGTVIYVLMINLYLSGQIRQGDQLLPLYIVERMSSLPGLPGLAVAGIFSGSLSTVSSAINSLAAVTLEVTLALKVSL